MKKLVIGIVKEEDMEPVFITINDQDKDFDNIVEIVSPEAGEISMITMNEIEVGNNLVVTTDAKSSISPSGYNMSIHIFPLFGTLVFTEFGMNNEGEIVTTSMSPENQEILKDYISISKREEKENGGRQAIIDRINEVGKDRYLRELDERYADLFGNEIEKDYKSEKKDE